MSACRGPGSGLRLSEAETWSPGSEERRRVLFITADLLEVLVALPVLRVHAWCASSQSDHGLPRISINSDSQFQGVQQLVLTSIDRTHLQSLSSRA